MRLIRCITSVLLAVSLLTAGTVVQAKKYDEDKPSKNEKWQRQDRQEAQDDRRRGRSEEPRYDERRYEERRYVEPRMSLSDAVAEAERRTGGQALSAEPRMENGRTSYRVKILTPNGRVQILYMDAN